MAGANERSKGTIESGQIEMRTLLKFAVPVVQGLVTVLVAVWYMASWAATVDKRLEDIDHDLKSIHERLDSKPPYSLPDLYPPATPSSYSPARTIDNPNLRR
jgi:hypothetical protein